MAARQTRGRQKIPMRLIQNQDDLYASFSKRRLGLFKKASELSTLCGADVGILVFSPTDNPFSFFSPSMESVVDRYINPDRPLKQAARAVDFHTRARIEALNKRLDDVMEQKLKLKEYDHQLAEAEKGRQRGWWEETAVDALTKDQLREWTAWFETFKARLQNKVAQLQNGGSSSSAAALNAGAAAGPSSSLPPPYYASVADQFGGGQYFGVAMQDQAAAAVNVSGGGGGGGGGGVAQYLLSSPPLDSYYRGFGGGGSSSNVFASQYRYYNMNTAEGGNPFAAGSSGGGGGGGGGGGSGQFVFSAGAGGGGNGQHFGGMVAPSSSGVNVPPMNFCFTPTPSYDEIPSIMATATAAAAATADGEEGGTGRGNSNQIQGRN